MKKESVNIELTAPLIGKRFKTIKGMAKAVRMEEKAFKVFLNTLLNNGAINMIHFNDQGWEIFFDGQGPWMTTDDMMAATGRARLTIINMARMMPSWMSKKESNRYKFRPPALEFVNSYVPRRRPSKPKRKISPASQFSPAAQTFWYGIPKEYQDKILENVWCGSCRKIVKIINFSGEIIKGGCLLLKGDCAVCKRKVVRYAEPLES